MALPRTVRQPENLFNHFSFAETRFTRFQATTTTSFTHKETQHEPKSSNQQRHHPRQRLKSPSQIQSIPPQNRAQQKRQRQLQQTTSKKMAGRFFGIVLLCLGSLKPLQNPTPNNPTAEFMTNSAVFTSQFHHLLPNNTPNSPLIRLLTPPLSGSMGHTFPHNRHICP